MTTGHGTMLGKDPLLEIGKAAQWYAAGFIIFRLFYSGFTPNHKNGNEGNAEAEVNGCFHIDRRYFKIQAKFEENRNRSKDTRDMKKT
jgi:hypothetical protein